MDVLVLLCLLTHAVMISGQTRDTIACYFWEDAIYHHGNCYKLFPYNSISRQDAKDLCSLKTSGGKLADTMGDKHLSDLQSLVVQGRYSVWLGPLSIDNDSFYNPDTPDSLINFPTSHWDIDQPFIPDFDLPCMVINSNGLLEATGCSSGIADGFICQQEADNVCDLAVANSVYFKGSCFMYEPKRLNYTMAQTSCQTTKSFPAEPLTPDLFYFVKEMAAKHPGDEWIGGLASEELNSTLTWWLSGITVTHNRSYWGSDPDNGKDDDRWMVMAEEYGNLFETESSEKLLTSICQYDAGNPCEWTYPGSVYSDGSCLLLYRRKLNWFDAKKACQKDNAILVEITSEALYHGVSQLARLRAGSTNVFIGLSDNKIEGQFLWQASKTELTLSKWAIGQPDNSLSNLDFVAINANTFHLTVLDDKATGYFICQKGWKKPQTHLYNIALPDLNSYHGDLKQETYLEVLTRFTSHKVYVKLWLFTPVMNSYFYHYVTHNDILRLDLTKHVYSDQFGINERRTRVSTSHPVSITLYYVIDEVKVTSLLYTPLHNKVWPSSYLVSTSGLTKDPNDMIYNQIAFIAASEPTDVTFRFPGHQVGNAVLNIGGMEVNVTGDIEISIGFSQTGILRLTGSLDGLFIYASHLLLITVTSEMENPAIPGGLAHIMSPILPSIVLANYYATFPSFARDGTGQNHFTDFYTIINLAAGNEIVIKGLENGPTLYRFLSFGRAFAINLPSDRFCLFSGTHQFYLIKHVHWNDGVTARNPCRTTVLPRRLWRRYYSLAVTPDDDLREVSLFLIIPEPFQSYVMVDDILINATCDRVENSLLFGCYVDLTGMVFIDEGKPHHVNIQDFASAFGAYLMVTSHDAIQCQAIGVIGSVSPKEKAIELDSVYQYKPPEPTPSTTLPTTSTPFPKPTQSSSPSPNKNITLMTVLPWSNTSKESLSSQSPTSVLLPTGSSKTTSTPNTSITKISTTRSSTTTYTQILPIPNSNLTEEEKQQLLFAIEGRLKIDARSTSAFKRRKTSAGDVRTSSTAIGLVGVAVMAVIFGFILFSDVIKVICFHYENSCRTRTSSCRRGRRGKQMS